MGVPERRRMFEQIFDRYVRINYFLKNTLLPLLYPRHCPVCNVLLPYGTFICKKCEKKLPFITEPTCFSCGKPISSAEQEYCYDCRIFPKSFHSGCSLLLYNGKTRPAMMSFKYENNRFLSQFFVREIIMRHRDLLQKWHPDAIIPIPIHKNKYKKRGYNQAELLAKDLSVLLNLSYYPNILIRSVDMLPQKQFDPQARLNNLQKAFALNPRYQKLLPSFSSVLLIDDIYTTGATMEACTRILLDGGVNSVYICSVCIGVSRD